MRAVELWDGCLRRACQGNELLRRLSEKDQWINGSLSWLELQGSPWLTSDLSVSNQNHCFQWSVTWTIGPCSNLQPHLKEKPQVHLPCVDDISLALSQNNATPAWRRHGAAAKASGNWSFPVMWSPLDPFSGTPQPSLPHPLDQSHGRPWSLQVSWPGRVQNNPNSRRQDEIRLSMKRIWWCSVVYPTPNFWIPLCCIFCFTLTDQCQWKKNIRSPSKTPVIKPYGPPHGGDVHDVSLLQFATHVLCLVDSRQPVGMPRRNGQQVTYQSWEETETMEWVSICQRSSMSTKIAVP